MMSISSRLDGFRRFSSRSRAAGSADVTARLQIVSWWYRTPLPLRLALIAGAVLAGAGAGYIAEYSPLVFGAVTLASILALGAILLAPQVGALMLVILITAPLFIPLGYAYTVAALPPDGDPVGGAVSLGILYGVGLWIAVRWSRGRAWVTAALMSLSLLFVGPLLFFTFPSLGINAARIAVAVVLLLRCGGAAWIVGLVGLLWSRIRNRSHLEDAEGYASAGPEDVSAAWRRIAAVEKETAGALSSLPKDFRVFHDMVIPKTGGRIGHIVIGPGGVVALSSVHAIGPVQEATKNGLIIPGVDLDSTIANLLASKTYVARALKTHPRDVSLAIVVYGQDACMDGRVRVAVHNAIAPGKALENVSIVPGEDLLSELLTPFSTWSTIKVQQTIRRAQMKLRPSVIPLVAPETSSAVEAGLKIARLDADGRVVDLADGKSSSSPGILVIGARVDVETTLGPIKNLRVLTTPVIDRNGEKVIYVCSDEEYLESSLTGEKPKGHSFPVGSIRLADSPAQ